MVHYVEQWGESTQTKWVLSIIQEGFRIPFNLPPPLSTVPIVLSQSSSLLLREEIKELLQQQAVERVSDPGTPVFTPGYFLYPKKWKVMSRDRSLHLKPVYKKTTFQNGDNQVRSSVDIDLQLGCLHRSNGCLSTCSNSSAIKEVPSLHFR